ncbi:MAG: cytochrome c maturation protein CcmE [Alphaproteobacteria bacterium]|nr:cytochrome c maturation protein CcmE [Alphaproteobacteria bacterium]
MLERLYKRRIAYILFTLLSLTVAGFLVIKAFRENLLFYFVPSDIKAGKAPINHTFRLGGLVEKGSVTKEGLTVYFTITDTHEKISVTYTGILPDLFREGHGVIVRGQMKDSNLFTAEEVLAKHNEKYAPPDMP